MPLLYFFVFLWVYNNGRFLLAVKCTCCCYCYYYHYCWSPDIVGFGTLEFTLVRRCVRASVLKILEDPSLDFSEILHEGTPTYRKKSNILGFLIKNPIAPPGVKRGQKMAKMALFHV